jgi:hypothetical protein
VELLREKVSGGGKGTGESNPFPLSSRRISSIADSPDVVFFPSSPGWINGKARFAWLSYSPASGRITSHFDTGEHGAMVEHVLTSLLADQQSYIAGVWTGVFSSVWTVSAFSLELDNYEDIIKASKKFLEGMAKDCFALPIASTESGAGADWGIGAGGAAASAGPLKLDFTSGGLKPNQNVLGWTNGFKAGVAYYFSH